VQRSSRHIVVAASSATPREPLLFLYPHTYSRRRNTTKASAAASYDTGSSAGDPAVQPQEQHEHQEATSQTPLRTAQSTTSPKAGEAGYNQDRAARRREDRINHNKKWANTVKAVNAWGGFSKGSNGLEPAQFKLAPLSLQRVKVKADHASTEKERRTVKNSELKSKGTWSYDWRVALLALRENTPSPANGEEPANKGPRTSSDTSSAVVRKMWDDDLKRQDGQGALIWDKNKFFASVKAATKSKVPRVLQRFLYSKGHQLSRFESRWAHKYQVRDALMRMFEDPAAYPIQTEEAFNTALRFLGHHVFFSDARKLINIMTKIDIPPTTDSFNILLWGAARRSDLFNFTSLLMTMIHRDIKPDTDTWRNFIVSVESHVVRLRIANTMKEMGLLEDVTVLQKVSMPLLDVYLRSYIQRTRTLPELMKQLDEMFGTEAWFTTYHANKICQRLGEAGRVDQIAELLNIMHARQCKPSNATLSSILLHCMRSQDVTLAYRFLLTFEHLDVELKSQEFGFLFMLAWKSKSYNLCRLIWSIACSLAEVPYRMQVLVFKSLIRNTPDRPDTDNQWWMKQAGKVIVGPGFGHPGQDHYHELSNRMKTVGSISQWLPNTDSDLRQAGLKLCKQLLTEDLTAVGRYDYAGNFLEDFALAMQIDEQWKSKEWRKSCGADYDDTMWKVHSVIKPKFVRKAERNVDVYLPEPKFRGAELLPSSEGDTKDI
jgi:hypothetical protein